jgi:hypothetical protein
MRFLVIGQVRLRGGFELVQETLISLSDQKLRGKQNRESITGRSENLNEILPIQGEENISPSQSRNQNWPVLAGRKNQGFINGDHIINK